MIQAQVHYQLAFWQWKRARNLIQPHGCRLTETRGWFVRTFTIGGTINQVHAFEIDHARF